MVDSCETTGPDSCDTIVALGTVTRDGQTIFGKNSDRPARECQPLVQHARKRHAPGETVRLQFLEMPQVEKTWAHIGSKPHWCWGYEQGFNEHQVVIGNEGLHSRFEFDTPKLIGMELVRLGLERGRTAAEAVEVITGLVTKYGQGQFEGNVPAGNYDNGYLVADPHEAYIIETAGHHWATARVKDCAGISNVYAIETGWSALSPAAEQAAAGAGRAQGSGARLNFAEAFQDLDATARAGSSGGRRRARSCSLLNRRAGALDVPTMMAILRDHGAPDSSEEPSSLQVQPDGVCIHCQRDGTGGATAASLVADLCGDGSRLPIYWCSFYSPCLSIFVPIFLEGTLAEALSAGGPDPDDGSAWWLFQRVVQAAQHCPEKTTLVRSRFRSLEAAFLEAAAVVSTQAGEHLRAGDAGTARGLLTDAMEGAWHTAERTARRLLHEMIA